MKSNDTSHIVRLSKNETPLRVSLRTESAHAPSAHHAHSSPHTPQVNFLGSRGLLSKLATLFLIPMIFIYPLAPAYADETASSTEVVASTEATPPIEATPPEVTPEVTTPSDSLTADVGSAIAGLVSVVSDLFSASSTENTAPADTTASSTATSSEEASTTPTLEESATSSDPVTEDSESGETATSTATSTDETVPPLSEGDQIEATSSSTPSTGTSTDSTTSSVIDASSTDALASTLPEVTTPTRTPEEIAQEMIRAQEDSIRASIRKEVENEFTKGCVSLDTTGYYCLKDRANGEQSLTPSNTITEVTSGPDASSVYKQIFMTRGGVGEQLTHASWDNAFPTTDIAGKSVVWQGNINGRWQIFYTDASVAGTTTLLQVTHSNESNFNPKVDGNDIVWQAWVDGNWEIFLAEHLSPTEYLSLDTLPSVNKLVGVDHTWRITRITTNSVHDMFPAVAGGLVTWQSFQDNAWNVYVYSVKTGATQKISSSGEKSEKPRFAITWDERSSSGNARMVGYDIATGKTIDITNEARQVNDESAPYKQPSAPISQPDQAALPTGGTASTTTSVKDDGGGDGSNDLGV